VNTHEIVQATGDWLLEMNPELVHAYPYSPMQKEADLPDVVVEVETSDVRLADNDFPFRDIQQALIRRWDMSASFMVENTNPEQAAEQLRIFADRATSSVLSDSTLGGRVPFISPFISFDYTPPFVEYADGTRGREMTMTISVGELVEADQ
jgi:hypothetical protein